MLVGLGSGGRILTDPTDTPRPALAACSSFGRNSVQREMTPSMMSCGPTCGMSFTAADTSTTWSPLSTPSLKSSKKSSFMADSSSFLDGLLIDRLDVDAHTVTVPPERVLG